MVTKHGKPNQRNHVSGESTYGKKEEEQKIISSRNCIYEGIWQIDSQKPLVWFKRSSLKGGKGPFFTKYIEIVNAV